MVLHFSVLFINSFNFMHCYSKIQMSVHFFFFNFPSLNPYQSIQKTMMVVYTYTHMWTQSQRFKKLFYFTSKKSNTETKIPDTENIDSLSKLQHNFFSFLTDEKYSNLNLWKHLQNFKTTLDKYTSKMKKSFFWNNIIL